MFFNMYFPENLKRLRNLKGLTLDELQLQTGISKRMLSGYEAGENDITLKKLQNIAMVLKVEVSELIQEKQLIASEPPAEYKTACFKCAELEKQVQLWKGRYEGLKEGMGFKNGSDFKQTGSV